MASSDAATLIKTRLSANWATTQIYQWEEHKEPMGATLTPFIVLEFPGGIGSQATIAPPGGREFVETGTFLVHIFIPTGSIGGVDMDTARSYAAQISTIFRGVNEIQGSSQILYRAPYPPYPGPPSDGNWLSLTVSVPYQWRFFG